MAPVTPELILRLGSHAEKEYFEKLMPQLDGMTVGANLVEATPAATASLFIRFGGSRIRGAVFIDPMTYAFGTYRQDGAEVRDLDWIKSEKKKRGGGIERTIKRSYLNLAERLGNPFDAAVTHSEAVSPQDFGDDAFERSVCRSVATYQLTRIPSVFEEDPEYRQYANEVPHPAAVLAPYFYLEPSSWRSWLEVVLRLAQKTVELNLDAPVHAVLCVDDDFLENAEFLELARDGLVGSGVDGVWLWFSRFAEEQATEARLRAYRQFVESLVQHMEVNTMHGGYFSLALSRVGMRRISHGVGYGEQKDVNPVIGQAIPTVRYYLPDGKRRVSASAIQESFGIVGIRTPQDFFDKVCDCVVCRGVVGPNLAGFGEFGETHYAKSESQRASQTPAAAKRCRYHFLLNRIRERDMIGGAQLNDIRQSLNTASGKWGAAQILAKDLRHLPRWERTLFDP